MKKLCLTVAVAALFISFTVNAETAKGRVVDTDGHTITVQTQNGEHVTMALTDHTTYRKKKMMKHAKKKHGKMYKKGDSYYEPLVEEDDWIELTYTPAKTSDTSAVVEDVIVYDD